MTKARQLADLGNAYDDGALSNRNLMTNGSMAVAQRSVSETGLSSTNSYKTVDRYTTYISSLGTWTQSQDTDAPSGFGHSLKMLCTTADASPASTNRMLIQTKIEGQDIQSLGFGDTSNTYTVSFYVKSNVTGTYILEHLGGTASATGHQISTPYTVNNVNTWERKTITLNVDSGAMTSDNTSGLALSFWLGTGSNYSSGTLNTSWSSSSAGNRAVGQVNLASATNNYWQITGLQLEVGDTATPFEHGKSYGEELAKCQRYYFQRNWTATYDSVLSPAWASSTNSFQGTFYMPTTMRAPPTLSHNGAGNFRLNNSVGGDEICNTITIQSSKNNSVVVNFFKATGNLTVTSSGYINTETTNDAYMYFDAEL
ncbi:hypothetical protein OAF92_01230 [bacterium]|nr:hypothetical protein [bacterium]